MRAIMDTAMRGGAMGMTTALIYPPSSYATTDELVEVGEGRRRSTAASTRATSAAKGKEVVQSVNEAITIGEKAGLPVEVFHLKVAHEPWLGHRCMDSVRMIDRCRARARRRRRGGLYVYTAGGTGLEATIPSWAFEGGIDSLKARLANPATRARLKREQKTGSPGWWNIIEAAGGWDGVVLVNARNPAQREVRAEVARADREGDWARIRPMRRWISWRRGSGRVMAIYHMMGEQDIETALRFPVDEHRQRRRRRSRQLAAGRDRASRIRGRSATPCASSPST